MRKSMFIAFSLILTTLFGVPARADEAKKNNRPVSESRRGSRPSRVCRPWPLMGASPPSAMRPRNLHVQAKRPNRFYTELRAMAIR